ncbi:hypothetical protein V3C99_018872 [Haemonchus contortus]|uniref:Uncharacterized protein n=1 Tax=Haemonchus contortus TaxID=6289 RepID=A0A7I5EE02_HAECO|nr:Hypothetical protein CBG16265 [Haemonchus contortus]
MATTEPIAKNTSPFLSIFHRKKRVNGAKSSDDIKAAAGPPREQATETATDKKRNTKKHDSTTLPAKLDTKKKKHKPMWEQPKSQSFDALLEEDPAVLVEALETIAAEQPIVARSIPKHAKITKREDRSMRNCLFEQEVYDSMLIDSLRVCDLLQTHLDECITSVRAKSPENCRDTSQDGRDSGRGASSASSTISSSPSLKRPLKSCIRADL